jgi:hypothetical protein
MPTFGGARLQIGQKDRSQYRSRRRDKFGEQSAPTHRVDNQLYESFIVDPVVSKAAGRQCPQPGSRAGIRSTCPNWCDSRKATWA